MQELVKMYIKYFISYIYFINKKIKHGKVINIIEYVNVFFGYYDVSSFNDDENFLALHGEKNNGELDIFIYDLKTDNYKIIGNTKAWNYQQGARIIWFSENQIIYNKYDSEFKSYYSVIKNINDLSEERIEFPIQTLYKKEYLLSIDYHELNTLKTEYGYGLESDNSRYGKLYKYNFLKKSSEVLFDFNECLDLLKQDYSQIKNKHFNHFLINETGNYFIFIFRFYSDNKRIDSLIGYSCKKNRLELLIENQLISHSTWKTKDTFLFWGSIDNTPGYYQYIISKNSLSLKVSFVYDGHPTFISENIILTDTYPNKYLSEKLFTLNIETGEYKLINEFSHPANYVPYNRCDLHPSISKSKKKFQVDFINKGKRNVFVGDL